MTTNTAKSKEHFSAIPIHAMGDVRFTSSHWRVIAAIAWHDRMGRNGVGCTASGKTLAREAAVHYTNLPELTDDLRNWGYISKNVRATDRRRRTYRVIYIRGEETVGDTANNLGSIVGAANPKASETMGQSNDQYIPLRGLDNRSHETKNSMQQTDSENLQALDETDGKYVHEDLSLHMKKFSGSYQIEEEATKNALSEAEDRRSIELAHNQIREDLGSTLYEKALDLRADVWRSAEIAECEDRGMGTSLILRALNDGTLAESSQSPRSSSSAD